MLDRVACSLARKPAETRNEGSGKWASRTRQIEDLPDTLRISAAERQNRRREDLAGLLALQLRLAEPPTNFPGDPQSIEMGLYAFVKPGEIPDRVVGGSDRPIPQEPEERRCLGVLRDDVLDARGGRA